MPFSLLANITSIPTVYLELFFNRLRVLPSLGVVMVGNHLVPYLCPHRDVFLPINAVRCAHGASHRCHLPNPVLVPIIPPAPSSRPSMMSRLFPLLLGRFPSIFLLTILYHGVLCRIWGQFNGSLPESMAVCCAHNCGDNQHLDLFTGTPLSEIEMVYEY